MNISSTAGGANINMGAISRPAFDSADDSDHDNGRRAHGKHDSFRSDFRSLLEAVQSGDMTSAQTALASIKNDVATANATYSPASAPPATAAQVVDQTTADPSAAGTTADASMATSTASPASTIDSDLKALFDAVGTGDASSAQAALSKFVSDRQAVWQPVPSDASNSQGQRQPGPQFHGHHHRHHGLESVVASLFSGSSNASPSTDSSLTLVGTATSSDPATDPTAAA
jgi:hypothetical protein